MCTSPSPSHVVTRLRAAGCVFAEAEARLLIDAAATPADLDALVDRRVAGLPLEHVLGWAEFCGHRMTVTPGVFVPRRRTEFLVRRAAALAHPWAVVLDLCCGSGAVGAALLHAQPDLDLHAVDIDPAAVDCARRNLPTATVHLGDLYAPLPTELHGRVDLILANAPYVPTDELGLLPQEARLHEPRTALDGGTDGLDLHRRIATAAPLWLAPHGHLIIETGEHQAPHTAHAMTLAGLTPRTAHSADLDATLVTGSRHPV